jgi:hypothetical protein
MRGHGRSGRTAPSIVYHENPQYQKLAEFVLTLVVLINDVVIIEPIVRDDLILGVAGILECSSLFDVPLTPFRRRRVPATSSSSPRVLVRPFEVSTSHRNQRPLNTPKNTFHFSTAVSKRRGSRAADGGTRLFSTQLADVLQSSRHCTKLMCKQ